MRTALFRVNFTCLLLLLLGQLASAATLSVSPDQAHLQLR